MKVLDFIDELWNAYNQVGDVEVCVFDQRKVIHCASEEPTSEGIHPEFTIQLEECAPEPGETLPVKHFIALSFENEDYSDDGDNIISSANVELLAEENERLRDIIRKVGVMRTAQRAYFRNKGKDHLIASKELEAEVDDLIRGKTE